MKSKLAASKHIFHVRIFHLSNYPDTILAYNTNGELRAQYMQFICKIAYFAHVARIIDLILLWHASDDTC